MNKPLLASYLFACEENALRVNQIIHPVVKSDFINWVSKHHSTPIIAMESAILIESGFADTVDHIVMVYAPVDVRLKRAMARDNVQINIYAIRSNKTKNIQYLVSWID